MCLEVMVKTMKSLRIAAILARIQTGYLSYVKQEW
jgi:hypothetical protein